MSRVNQTYTMVVYIFENAYIPEASRHCSSEDQLPNLQKSPTENPGIQQPSRHSHSFLQFMPFSAS